MVMRVITVAFLLRLLAVCLQRVPYVYLTGHPMFWISVPAGVAILLDGMDNASLPARYGRRIPAPV